jgi:hypothetical protein
MKTTEADKWFSIYIRLRDSDGEIGQCVTCGKFGSVKYMDCGHYIKRQYAARFNEINCQLQCKKCNWSTQGNDVKFRAFLAEKYGNDAVLLLESTKHKSAKMGKFELQAIVDEYKPRVEALVKEKGVMKWW